MEKIEKKNKKKTIKKIEKNSKKKRNTIKFSQEQINLIHGCLLGDSSLETQRKDGKTWRLRFGHKAAHKAYTFSKYEKMKEFCGTRPRRSKRKDERTLKIYSKYTFSTLTFSELTEFADLYYGEKKNGRWIKHVPQNIVEILNDEVLAYWFMDDGSLKERGKSNAVRLSTEGFLPEDVERLAKALEEKFNFSVSVLAVSKAKPWQKRITILESSYSNLAARIGKYLHPCMYYKFPDGKKGIYKGSIINP